MKVLSAGTTVADSTVTSATPYLASISIGVASTSHTFITLKDCQMDACIQEISTTTCLPPAYTSCFVLKTNVPCHETALTVTHPGPGETSSSTRMPWTTQVLASADTEQREAHDESLSTGIILGATLGPVALLVLVCVLCCLRKRRGDEESDEGHEHWSTAATDGSSHGAGY